MSATQNNSHEKGSPRDSKATPAKLDAPWRIHAYVWVFMVTFGVTPLLYVLVTRDQMSSADWLAACIAVALLQGLLWIAQRRCSSADLTYWEGLLAAAAAVDTGSYLISVTLSFFMLLFIASASFVFALFHDANSPTRHASLCFGKLVVAVYRSRYPRRR
jgi:hypothetical protein